MFDRINAPQDAQLILFCEPAERRSSPLFRSTFLLNLTMVTDFANSIHSIHRQVMFHASGNQLGCSQYALAVAGGCEAMLPIEFWLRPHPLPRGRTDCIQVTSRPP